MFSITEIQHLSSPWLTLVSLEQQPPVASGWRLVKPFHIFLYAFPSLPGHGVDPAANPFVTLNSGRKKLLDFEVYTYLDHL